jgi:hypothetical protein
MKRVSDLLEELDKLSASVAQTTKRSAPAPRPQPPAAAVTPRRTIHLGLDYGTASSKLVLRDYEPEGRERAHIVFPSGARGTRARDFRIPSLVGLEAGRLWFGLEAAARQSLRDVKSYPSIKTRMAMPQEFHGLATPLPDGVTADDLATLTVAYLLQEGQRAAEALAKRYRAELAFTFTLGVPMSELDNSHLRGRFVDVARRAWQIVQGPAAPDLRTGIPVLEGWLLVSDADEAIRRQPAPDPRRWVRAEVEAALLWPFKSDELEPGVYAAVDVGAGATSASFFHVGANEGSKSLGFFATSCLAPGADAVDAALVGFAGTSDPAAIRAKENSIVQRVGDFPVTGIASQITRTVQQAFDRAWEKNAKPAAWDGYRLLLTGGGTEIEILRRKLSLRAGPKLRHSPQVVGTTPPLDLDLDGVPPADLKYLTVAYGLSHFDAEVPCIALATDPATVVLKKPE